jgi:hypothetical protein
MILCYTLDPLDRVCLERAWIAFVRIKCREPLLSTFVNAKGGYNLSKVSVANRKGVTF